LALFDAALVLADQLRAAIQQHHFAVIGIDIAGQAATGDARYGGVNRRFQRTVQGRPLGDDEIPVGQYGRISGLGHGGFELRRQFVFPSNMVFQFLHPATYGVNTIVSYPQAKTVLG